MSEENPLKVNIETYDDAQKEQQQTAKELQNINPDLSFEDAHKLAEELYWMDKQRIDSLPVDKAGLLWKKNAQINEISKDVYYLEKHHVANKNEALESGVLNDMALAAYYKNGGTTKLPLLTPAQTESYFQELQELKKMVEHPQPIKDTPDREYG